MVIVHVISGDSPLVHITWENGRVRIMVLNLQARKLTCSSQTHCKGLLVHEKSLIGIWFASTSRVTDSLCWSSVQHR